MHRASCCFRSVTSSTGLRRSTPTSFKCLTVSCCSDLRFLCARSVSQCIRPLFEYSIKQFPWTALKLQFCGANSARSYFRAVRYVKKLRASCCFRLGVTSARS
ncbi:hypothetical protein PUN28_020523 [Cardiocondyla obscurior]|uniref:Secreted protein n=1 Tax=Cardiocondyla obscurior TaxID=286306 RepID=A0AAW2E5L9_9HYME